MNSKNAVKTAVGTPADNMSKNAFLRTLAELRKGMAMTEATNEMARVIQEVQKTGRAGEIKVTLKITPTGEEEVAIEDSITSKVPKKATLPTTFFVTEEGELSRNNPAQPEMFKTIDGGKGEAVAPEVAPAQVANA